MPMPLWFGHVNKRIFNKMELRKGKRPVLAHVGRSSGKTYRTPLDAHPIAGGYMFILVYGSGSDWVQNILASGTAILEIDGKHLDLAAPRVVGPDAALAALRKGTRLPPKFMNVTEFLQMELDR